jgi:hypothetical protein
MPMTQTERIHNLQRLWGTIEARIASDSDLREKVEFRMLNELIKGLHGRPELTVVVNNVVKLRG